MTPRPADPEVVLEKLALLHDLLDDLARQGEPRGDELAGDRDRRHVIERILTQLVDIAVGCNGMLLRGQGKRAPTTYRDSFDLLARSGVLPDELAESLARSVGMRNLLTHEYGRIDLDQVAAAVPVARSDYTAYVDHVRAHLRTRT